MRKNQAGLRVAAPVIPGAREWTVRAKCRDSAGEQWDTEPKEFNRDDPHARARELCAGCAVVRECARDAVDYPAWGTVRGGVALPDMNSRATTRRAAAVVLARVALGVDDRDGAEVVE